VIAFSLKNIKATLIRSVVLFLWDFRGLGPAGGKIDMDLGAPSITKTACAA